MTQKILSKRFLNKIRKRTSSDHNEVISQFHTLSFGHMDKKDNFHSLL